MGRVINFSLPAGKTCPGSSDWCKKFCYAKKNTFMFPGVQTKYKENLEISRTEMFVKKILEELGKNKTPLVRIHVSGDFYSVSYIDKWKKIVKESEDKKFFATTRSWCVPKLRDSLEELRELPNIALKASTDSTLSNPPRGWAEMGVDKTNNPDGKLCGYQAKKLKCSECKSCWGKETSTIMKKH